MGELIQATFGLREILEDMHLKRDSNTCGQCGQGVIWAENQFKKHCSKCGSVIIRSSAIPKQATKCWICMDGGLVEYEAYIDGMKYFFGAACTCEKGQNFLCESVPRIDQVLMGPPIPAIIQRNKDICKAE
jgi:ribosomal protein S27AE